MQLTKSIIDKISYSKTNNSRQFVWDAEISGFGLRVYPSGKKSFVLSYWMKGRKHLFTIGSYGVLTVDQARREARRLYVDILDGIDPLENKKRNKADKSVRQLGIEFVDKHSKIHKKTWKTDKRRIEEYINPAIGNYAADSITKSDIISLHQKIGQHAIYEANRTISLLGTMFRFGKEWGFLEPMAAIPTQGIKKYKELERDRWVTPEEMPRLAEAIDGESSPFVRAAIWLYLLTGLRKTELLEAKWSNVDWVRKEIKIEGTKNGSNHHVPLSENALAVLRTLPRFENNPYVIAGKIPGAHLVNISKPWNRIKKAAKVEDVRLHDLRRTTGSWLAQKGNSLHLIARVLNHRSSNTTKIYARFGQNHVREALEDYGRDIFSPGNEKSAKIC